MKPHVEQLHSNYGQLLKDYRLPLELEIPTTPFHVSNNLFVVGWSQQFEGIHLLKLSIMSMTWKDEVNFIDYINMNDETM